MELNLKKETKRRRNKLVHWIKQGSELYRIQNENKSSSLKIRIVQRIGQKIIFESHKIKSFKNF